MFRPPLSNSRLYSWPPASTRGMRMETPVDSLCATLVTSADHCVTFKFADGRACDHFVTCMRLLRLAMD